MTLAGLIARRLARACVVVWLVGVAAWLMAEAAPGSATERAARASGVLPADELALPAPVRDQLLSQVAAAHDLDDPWLARLGRFAAGMLTGELGRSWRDGARVRAHLGRAAAPTLILVLLSLLVAALAGVTAAALSARRPGSPTDAILGVAGAAAFSLPPVWLAMVGLRVLADGHPFRLVPPGGLGSAASLILPVMCLALLPGFAIARHARAALVDAAAAPWAIAARARGASRARVVTCALRATAPALMPLGTVITAYLIGATMVIEEVFAIRGLGSLLTAAARAGDAPVIVGVCVCAGAIVGLASGLADLAQRALDPRLRGDPP